MKLDFALVTEGVTDQIVLENILIGFFQGHNREPDINPEFPNPQDDGKVGGWTLVLNYLRTQKYRQALQIHKYIIVQVDTDISEDRGFDVSRQDENGPLSIPIFIEKVKARLISEINNDDWEVYKDCFIFAIGVEQLECWLLPIWFSDSKGSQIANCTMRLGSKNPNLIDELTKKNYSIMTSGCKEPKSYEIASRAYRKRKNLFSDGVRNESLKIFLDSLQSKSIILQ